MSTLKNQHEYLLNLAQEFCKQFDYQDVVVRSIVNPTTYLLVEVFDNGALDGYRQIFPLQMIREDYEKLEQFNAWVNNRNKLDQHAPEISLSDDELPKSVYDEDKGGWQV